MAPNKILLVDDDPGIIQMMARILAGIAEVRFATSGADALRLARQAPPDLVLLDAEMPGMSGFEVCQQFKADPALAEVPVIFVTSHAEVGFEIAGIELGAADFIAKPVSPPLLLARVRTQLRVKHLSDEVRRLTTIDPPTGPVDRDRFDDALQRESPRARHSADPIARPPQTPGDGVARFAHPLLGDNAARQAAELLRAAHEAMGAAKHAAKHAGRVQGPLRIAADVEAPLSAHDTSPALDGPAHRPA